MRTLMVVGLMLILGANQARAETDLERARASTKRIESATFTMPGCHEARPATTSEQDYLFLQGLCHGKMQGVIDTAQATRSVCPPDGVADYEQALHIVVKYIDGRLNQGDQRFTRLAFEALRAAWPCR